MEIKFFKFPLILFFLALMPNFGAAFSLEPCKSVLKEFNRIKQHRHSGKIIDSDSYQSAQAFMDECVASRFSACYPSLKQEVLWSELIRIFNMSITDKEGRMNSPGSSCYARAYTFAHRLAEAGYSSRQIWIQESPTLVAINLSSDGSASSFSSNGRDLSMYNDYEGGHAVVSVKMKLPDGAVREVILDPQFFSKPMSFEEYFITTMGQICINRTGQPREGRPIWGCSFVTRNAFDTLEDGGWMNSDYNEVKIEQCGWNHRQEYLEEILNSNRRNPLPIPFSSDTDVNAFRREMILRGFQKKKLDLENRLAQLKSSTSGAEEEQVISKALNEFSAVVRQVRKNLSFVIESK